MILPLAYFVEAWARLFKKGEPLLTMDGVRLAKKTMFFSTEKAKRELGFSTRPAQEALGDAVDWFRTNGYI
jgi:dihydroflavonol-4-reductase